ncbi:hypothetical protein SteCoe_32429 [Stentor coeruleus]|uniref:Uncharacterized protein n=1 Tax=Stentor coeruleus TaxID=5963 RepID=A0A1R2AZ03_9CILI|nr:hypothetical protein SteCoe_32429 [Stentor coeruleus]
MSGFYIYALLGPSNYSKHELSYSLDITDCPLKRVKKIIVALKKTQTKEKIRSQFGLSSSLHSLIFELDYSEHSEIYRLMTQLQKPTFSKEILTYNLTQPHSIEDICRNLPLHIIIETLDKYSTNPLVKATLGCTAESTKKMLIAHKILVLSNFLKVNYTNIHSKLKLQEMYGNTLRRDYLNMVYFLVHIITSK